MLRKPLIISFNEMPEEMYATGKEAETFYTLIVDATKDARENRKALSNALMILHYHDKNPDVPLIEIVERVNSYAWDFSEAPDLQRKYPCGGAKWKEFH